MPQPEDEVTGARAGDEASEASPTHVTWSMLARARVLLSVAAISRAAGLTKTTLYGRIKRETDPTQQQSDTLVTALAAAGILLLPDAGRPSEPGGPSVVTAVMLRRAKPFLATDSLSVLIGRHHGWLRHRLRRSNTVLSEAEALLIASALASVGVELVADPDEAEHARHDRSPTSDNAWLEDGPKRWRKKKIRALRKRLELNRSEMAAAVGYRDARSVRLMELGLRVPNGPTYRVLDYLAAYGVIRPDSGQSDRRQRDSVEVDAVQSGA